MAITNSVSTETILDIVSNVREPSFTGKEQMRTSKEVSDSKHGNSCNRTISGWDAILRWYRTAPGLFSDNYYKCANQFTIALQVRLVLISYLHDVVQGIWQRLLHNQTLILWEFRLWRQLKDKNAMVPSMI